jgi:hypothetical protein
MHTKFDIYIFISVSTLHKKQYYTIFCLFHGMYQIWTIMLKAIWIRHPDDIGVISLIILMEDQIVIAINKTSNTLWRLDLTYVLHKMLPAILIRHPEYIKIQSSKWIWCLFNGCEAVRIRIRITHEITSSSSGCRIKIAGNILCACIIYTIIKHTEKKSFIHFEEWFRSMYYLEYSILWNQLYILYLPKYLVWTDNTMTKRKKDKPLSTKQTHKLRRSLLSLFQILKINKMQDTWCGLNINILPFYSNYIQ